VSDNEIDLDAVSLIDDEGLNVKLDVFDKLLVPEWVIVGGMVALRVWLFVNVGELLKVDVLLSDALSEFVFVFECVSDCEIVSEFVPVAVGVLEKLALIVCETDGDVESEKEWVKEKVGETDPDSERVLDLETEFEYVSEVEIDFEFV